MPRIMGVRCGTKVKPTGCPAIAANPFFSFFTTATESGKFEFEWTGDKGFSETASAPITVE